MCRDDVLSDKVYDSRIKTFYNINVYYIYVILYMCRRAVHVPRYYVDGKR